MLNAGDSVNMYFGLEAEVGLYVFFLVVLFVTHKSVEVHTRACIFMFHEVGQIKKSLFKQHAFHCPTAPEGYLLCDNFIFYDSSLC